MTLPPLHAAPRRSRWSRTLGLPLLLSAAVSLPALACPAPLSPCEQPGRDRLLLIHRGQALPVLVERSADPAVLHAARAFAGDLQRLGGRPAALLRELPPGQGMLVLIGVLGSSPLIDGLVASGRLRADDLKGQWEAFRQVTVDRPFAGVRRALVIVGSDRRGAVFGAYDLSARLGVSPWHWWADVPVPRRAELHLTAGERREQPVVKYRGFFINDEMPAFSTWAKRRFGGPNAKMYAQVFELLLRLKGNYLWPAMWQPHAFHADDPENTRLADEMGVVIGSSHHEPMMRAHDEWRRYGGGKWDYRSNAEQLRSFWRGGIERMHGKPGRQPYDSLVTLGMRGDGDEPMSEETATESLERIVRDQRQILAEVSGKPAEQTPQVWALYKEVQDYYDQGMQVPDDVLLLFADDNWGQIRRLPEPGQRARRGGFGVYYHFDYVGSVRNYKWLNTNQIEKTWQQMNLAHERGAHGLWIVNVGDIKPLEFPLHFFLDMAWNPAAMSLEAMNDYTRRWAADTFGEEHGREIAPLIATYSRYAARRKPELVALDSFTLGAVSAEALFGGEFGARIAEWDALEREVARVRTRLRPSQLDAYFQLVEHPVQALATLYRVYYHSAWNRRLAATNDARANVFAELAEEAFARDRALNERYHALQGGKWAGMMLQTRYGYTGWQSPRQDAPPALVQVPAMPTPPQREAVLAQLRAGSGGPPAGIERQRIEAVQFRRSEAAQGLRWTAIPNLGHHQGAIAALPQGREPTTVADGVVAAYELKTGTAGAATLSVHWLPTLDTRQRGGIRLAVAVDEREPQVLTLDLDPAPEGERRPQQRAWSQAMRDNEAITRVSLGALSAGPHVLRVWRLDDNALVQAFTLEIAAP